MKLRYLNFMATPGSLVVERPTARRRRPAVLLGPAFVASIAYVDPGNVAANLTAGAEYGYLLVWVLVAANGMAMLVQYLSAKLGLVSGQSLPEVLAERMPRTSRLLFWGQAELVAIATDLAEVIGGALALKILFGVPLLLGGVIVGIISTALLAVQSRRGQRPLRVRHHGAARRHHRGLSRGVVRQQRLVGCGGRRPRATVRRRSHGAAGRQHARGPRSCPHAIYLHSSLARDRHDEQARTRIGLQRLLRSTKWDVGISLLIAGSVNIAMLLLAAASLPGVAGTDSIEGAHAAIESQLGSAIGVIFGIGLLASGLASTSVGCYAGASIMGGLLRVRVPLLTRRVITLVPALVILAIGVNPTWALVLSQVALSIGIPFALIPLVRLTSSRSVMGSHVNRLPMKVAAWLVVGLIVALNLVLIALTVSGQA